MHILSQQTTFIPFVAFSSHLRKGKNIGAVDRAVMLISTTLSNIESIQEDTTSYQATLNTRQNSKEKKSDECNKYF